GLASGGFSGARAKDQLNRGVEGVMPPSTCGLGRDAGASDFRRKPEVSEHGAGHQMDDDVKPPDRDQSEWVLDKQAEHAQEQQDDPKDLQVRASARQARGGGDAGNADNQVDEVVDEVDRYQPEQVVRRLDRKSTRLNSSHLVISY